MENQEPFTPFTPEHMESEWKEFNEKEDQREFLLNETLANEGFNILPFGSINTTAKGEFEWKVFLDDIEAVHSQKDTLQTLLQFMKKNCEEPVKNDISHCVFWYKGLE